MVEAGSTKFAIHRDAEAAIRGEHRDESLQSCQPLFQVIQDTAAINIIEGVEAEFTNIEERPLHKLDIIQPANLRAPTGDILTFGTEIEMDDRAWNSGVGHLLPHHDRSVSGAADGNKNP